MATEKETLMQEVVELRLQKEKVLMDIDEINKKHSKAKSEFETLTAENERLAGLQKDQEAKITANQAEINELESKKASITMQVEEEIDNKMKGIEIKEKEVEKALSDAEELRTAHEKKGLAVKAKEKEINTQAKVLEAKENELTEKEGEIEKRNISLMELEKAINDLKAVVEEKDAKFAEWEISLKKRESEANAKHTEGSTLKEQYETAMTAVDAEKAKLEEDKKKASAIFAVLKEVKDFLISKFGDKKIPEDLERKALIDAGFLEANTEEDTEEVETPKDEAPKAPKKGGKK